MGDGDEVEAAFGLVGEAVVVGDGFVDDDEVGLDQVADGEVVAEQVADELDGLLAQVSAVVAGEFGEAFAVRFEDAELIEAEPLGGELAGEAGEAGVGDEAGDLGVELLAQGARGGEAEGGLVGRAVPEEVGELGGEFVLVERFGGGGGALFDQQEELRGGEDDLEGALDAVLELAVGGEGAVEDGEQVGGFGVGDGTAVGAGGEAADDFAGVGFGVGLAGRVKEDGFVGRRGPGLVEGTFELDGAEAEAGDVAVVGVLAADGDFADAGEVVDVILFDFGAGVVLDGAFENEAAVAGAGDDLRSADGGEGAAAVAAEADVDAEAGVALFEGCEALGEGVGGGNGGEDEAFEAEGAVGGGADGERAGGETNGEEGGLLEGAGELAIAEGEGDLLRRFGRGLNELAAGLEEALEFGFAEGAAVEPDVVDFAAEGGLAGEAADLESEAEVIEVSGADLALGDLVAVDIEAGQPGAAFDDDGDVLPGAGADDAGGGGEGAVGLVVGPGGFELEAAAAAVATAEGEAPTGGPVVAAEREEAGAAGSFGLDPGGEGEGAGADAEGFVGRDDDGVGIGAEGEGFAEGGVDEAGVAFESAFGLVIKRPGGGEGFAEPGGVRRGELVAALGGVDVDLIDAGLGNGEGLGGFEIGEGEGVGRGAGGGAGVEQEAVVVLGGGDGDAEAAVVGELAEGDFEVGFGAVGAFGVEGLFVGDGGTEEKAGGDGAVGLALGVAVRAAHAGEDGVVDARVFAPAADRIVALVALDEAVVGAHGGGREGEGLFGGEFGDGEVFVVEQEAAGAEDELFGQGVLVDGLAEVHAEVLDGGFLGGVDDGAVEGFFGDFEVGLDEEGGELEGVFIIDEAIGGDGVGGDAFGEVVFELEELAEGVAVLGDGEAADEPVFGGGAEAGDVDGAGDPGDGGFAFGGGGLGHAFGGHAAVADAVADAFPEADVAVFEAGIEMVDADAGGEVIGVVALFAVLVEEGFDGLLEAGFEGGRRGGGLSGEVVGGPDGANEGGRRESAGRAETVTEDHRDRCPRGATLMLSPGRWGLFCETKPNRCETKPTGGGGQAHFG